MTRAGHFSNNPLRHTPQPQSAHGVLPINCVYSKQMSAPCRRSAVFSRRHGRFGGMIISAHRRRAALSCVAISRSEHKEVPYRRRKMAHESASKLVGGCEVERKRGLTGK